MGGRETRPPNPPTLRDPAKPGRSASAVTPDRLLARLARGNPRRVQGLDRSALAEGRDSLAAGARGVWGVRLAPPM
jgi:hypothetical protein